MGAKLPFFCYKGREMIYGIGTDIIEVSRIQKAIEKNNGVKEKIFSQNEIAYCEARASKYQSYAARFAGKEAVMKAFGTGWIDGIAWNEIEILNRESGAPYLILTNKTKEIVDPNDKYKIHISLSHLKEYAIAKVIIEQ